MPRAANRFSTVDGLNIHTRAWLPEGAPKAVVAIVHGLAEHSARYEHVAATFSARGYAVYALDQRGHGRSAGPRAYFERFDDPVRDLRQYVNQIRPAHPATAFFLYGHSLGSLIALCYALEQRDDLAGLISTGTPLGLLSSTPRVLLSASAILNRVVPKLPVAPLNSALISRDEAVVAAYDSDPLVHRGAVRVRMGYQLLHASREIQQRLGELRLPLLILHGGADRLTPPSGSTMLADGAASADKICKIYPDLFHEIHNEPEQDTVLSDIIAWLEAHH